MENNGAIFEGLNDEQRKAVSCVEGPVLIVAGAGSGKTRVLTSRVANILESGADPSSILALTFTKKAAGEMKERIALMVGPARARKVVMGTFHAVFVRFLREYAEFLGYPARFTIYDQSDSTSAVKACIKELQLDDKIYKPKEVLSRISMAKNNLVTVGGYRANTALLLNDSHSKKPRLVDIYDLYQKKLKQSGAMDFDDILLNMNILLRDNKEALKSIADRFSHIMVDEYQDTNYAQYLILKKLSQFHHNLCVVGDDSQSIYAFRGAKIENILNFKNDYPEYRLFRLERNYRSTRTIVDAANSLIAHNEGRIPKECYAVGGEGERIRILRSFSEGEEAMLIVGEIMARMRAAGAAYEDFAILYRTNSQSRAIEEQLRRRNIPYMIYSGNSFFERAEVKDMMAYFKLVVNPLDDESFKRVVNKPGRGIGDTTLAALGTAAQVRHTTLYRAVFLDDLEQFGLRPAAVEKLRQFCRMVDSLAVLVKTTDAFALAQKIADVSGLYAFYKADTSIEGQARTANVEELVNSVQAFVEERQEEYDYDSGSSDDAAGSPAAAAGGEPVFTLDDFLENVSLLSNVDVSGDEDTNNKVSLMTVHSAKGLEYPYVFVAGMEENLFPSGGMLVSKQDIEEERRLFYVALTRAKKAVTLSFASTRMRNGKHENNAPSRFLHEVDPQYIENPLSEDDFEVGDTGGFGSRSRFDCAGDRGRYKGRDSDYGSRGSSVGYGGGSRYGQSSAVRYERRPAGQVSGSGAYSSGKSAGSSGAGTPSSRVIPPRATPEVIDPDFVAMDPRGLKVGMRIEHNRFGGGLVKEITGTYPDQKAHISFDDYGEKLLLLKYAKLRLEILHS